MKFIALKIVLYAKFMTPRCKINLSECLGTKYMLFDKTLDEPQKVTSTTNFQPQLMATMFLIGTFA